MDNQEKNLTALFQQLGDRKKTVDTPDFRLKDAVFSTIDATSLIADVVDLFTLQFVKAQSAVADAFMESEHENMEKQRLLTYFEKKRREKRFDTEGSLSELKIKN